MNTHTPGRGFLLAAGMAVTLGIGLSAAGPAAFAADRAGSAPGPATVALGTAAAFGVLAGGPAVTSTGETTISGDVGIDPYPTVGGLPPGRISGTIHRADGIAGQAKRDLAAAYTPRDDPPRRPTGRSAG